MQFDHTEQIKALAAMPPEPQRPVDRGFWGSTWDAIKGGGRGVRAGAAEVLGSVADVSKGISVGALATRGDSRAPVGMDMPGDDFEPQRVGVPAGEVFRSEVGRSFRTVANELRPDPSTAGLAEQVVFDVARVLAKLIPATMAGGGAGLALAAGEEGFTQSDALAAKGVDLKTRTMAGVVAAGVTGASAGLPLMGPTLKATAGLYLAGGPGAFMAQQAMTRAILERADYADLAATYDPLDPIGLALSALIPLPFAGYGALRNIRAARAAAPKSAITHAAGDQAQAVPKVAPEPIAAPVGVSRDAVDAALAHNLTLHADDVAARPVPEVAAVPAPVGPTGAAAEVVTERGLPTPAPYAAGIQPPAVGLVRLYRADSPTVKFEDIFKVQNLGEFKRPEGMTGELFTPELKLAQYYQRSYGADAVISYIDVPTAALEGRDGTAGEYFIDIRPINAPRPAAAAPDAQQTPTGAAAEVVTARGMDAPISVAEIVRRVVDAVDALGDPRQASMLDDAAVTQENVAADAVARMRTVTDDQLNGSEPALSTPKADALMRSVTDRVQAIEMQSPDMRVTDDLNAAEFMAQARREAAEGTDLELGALDADLLRVAADCALSSGAAP